MTDCVYRQSLFSLSRRGSHGWGMAKRLLVRYAIMNDFLKKALDLLIYILLSYILENTISNDQLNQHRFKEFQHSTFSERFMKHST